MKFSENWLREWVNIPLLTTENLTHQLTMLGLEVDADDLVAPEFTQVLVGEIIEATQHPNADRLKVCRVNVGQADLSTIVCGAPNARAGIKVPVALPGAELPNGIKIKRAQLRGVESEGMICSAKELGLVDEKDGIMELSSDAPIGLNFRTYLQLDDHVIEVSITPNRGDCLSIRGIAREVAAVNQIGLTEPVFQPLTPMHLETFPIQVKSLQDCPCYAGRVIKNINPNVQTPVWMQERLKRSGVRSIHPVVDITNYVMLELGQPMHAFDLDRLQGAVIVRRAQDNEQLILLDGKTVTLHPDTLVIADQKQAHALAGVMGGSHSMVNEQTTSLFLESAFFNPLSIRRSVQVYGLHTDSSQRFERGVDSALAVIALERATQLILSLMGGDAGPVQAVESTEYIPVPPTILLRQNQIERMLGFSIPDEQVINFLSSLGMNLKVIDEGWEVTPPTYRFDIQIESDLIEELVRLYGYDHIPMEKTISYSLSTWEETQSIDRFKARQVMADRGYHEAISYSFISEEYHQWFASEQAMITLSNPISQDMSTMRSSLWPGLVKTFLYNQNRQQDRVRLFEIGVCFSKENQTLLQKEKIAGLAMGTIFPEQWSEKNRNIDFYDVKGDIESLFSSLGCHAPTFVPENLPPVLHPGQAAAVIWNGQCLGYVGALHPHLMNTLKLTEPLYLFELDVALMNAQLLKRVFEPFSKFPAVRRDVSLIVDKNLSWKELKEKIAFFSNEYLSTVELFDIYEGKPISSDKKSVSIALTFQSKMQTLVEAEVNQQMEDFLNFLKRTINMTLRD